MPFIFKVPPPPTWDIASATYSGLSGNFNPPATYVVDFAFKSDGTKVFILDTDTDKIIQYSLNTPWNISTRVADNIDFSVTNGDGLFFKPDGTKFYVVFNAGDFVRQYTLPTPWVLTGATASTLYVINQNTGPQAVTFKTDGTKMYVYGNSTTRGLYQYSLSSPWVVDGSASYDGILKNFGLATAVRGITFKPDGTKFYMVIPNTDSVRQYNLSTSWDILTTSLVVDKVINPPTNFPYGIDFKTDGSKMYVGTPALDTIYQFDL